MSEIVAGAPPLPSAPGSRRQDEQEALFRALTERTSDVALVADADGNLTYVSPSAERLFGYRLEDLVLSNGFRIVHPDDVEPVAAMLAAVLAEPYQVHRMVLRIRDGGGRWRWVEETVTNMLGHPGVGGLVINLHDIDAQVAAERALRTSEARFKAIVETTQEGLLALAPDGSTLFANEESARILGLPVGELYRVRLGNLLGAEGQAFLAQLVRTSVSLGRERYELTYRRPDGGERVLAVTASPLPDEDGAPGGSLAMISDVTDERRTAQQLRDAALHDVLTGLPNRTLLYDRLDLALRWQQRSDITVAVLLVDLVRFGRINESRGHRAGDEVLVEVARRLQELAPAGDTVARLGGDRFAVVCSDLAADGVRRLGRRIVEAVARPMDVSCGQLHLTARVGCVLSPPTSGEELLRAAEAAVRSAKVAGRAGVVVHDAELLEHAVRRAELCDDLRKALAGDELELHYQPIISLVTGATVGVEALLRWNHPERGFVPPPEVVSVAEENGLVLDLDAWVLRRACEDGAVLRGAGALPLDAYVAVNLSARHLSAGSLEATVDSALAATATPPAALVLEITESAVVEDVESAAALLHRLRAKGVGVAVDDFGTGQSSLAYLRLFPVTILKVDRSFVEHMTTDPAALAIVTSIMDLARAVGVTVVAEGIEQQEQADALRALGCPAGQGWLWSPARPPRVLLGERQAAASGSPSS
ncbi:MAG: hypothetical protein JWM48_592 [Mycobacterium sp.]|nr:hypothetical protein [Mycobacterium sp.]